MVPNDADQFLATQIKIIQSDLRTPPGGPAFQPAPERGLPHRQAPLGPGGECAHNL